MFARISLDKFMVKYNLRVVDVEKKSGIHRNVITKYKNNEVKRVDLDVISRLCEALKCGISDLLILENNKTASAH